MIEYDPKDFSSQFARIPKPSAYFRVGIITHVNPSNGTINFEWLDHPGARQETLLTFSGQGVYELPPIGSVILVGFDNSMDAYIVGYIPIGYQDLVEANRVGDNGKIIKVTPSIAKIDTGEKMLISYLSQPTETKGKFATPVPTGTYFRMSNIGDILMKTAEGDYWRLDRRNNIIQQNSINYRAITEAGILDFGLVKRQTTDSQTAQKTTENIISTSGVPLGEGHEVPLTEFRLRVLETADVDANTPPEVENPLVELTLGTKVTDSGTLVKTDTTHATTSDNAPKEIMIQLKTKADQGFEFTVDKEGNLTVKVKGNVRVDVVGDSDITVNGNSNIAVGGDSNIAVGGDSDITVEGNSDITIGGDSGITVEGDSDVNIKGDSDITVEGNSDIKVTNNVNVKASKMTFNAGDIAVGSDASQKVVLSSFLTKYYAHIHAAPSGGGSTGTPIASVGNPQVQSDTDTSTDTKVG